MRGASTFWLLPIAVLAACTGSIENGTAPDGRNATGDKAGNRPGSQPGAGSSADRPGDPGDPSNPSDPSDDPSSPADDPACAERSPGESPIRRLSNAEYRNTIADLLDDEALADQVTGSFVSETESLGFRNSAKFLQVNTVTAQHYMDAAEEIAKQVRAKPASVLPCAPPAANAESSCAAQFIRDFGRKAYRRPLTDDEVASYQAIYDKARADYGFAAGIEWLAFALLQSPHFLNRVEFGAAPANGGAYARPSSYEMASRLSFLLWQSMPDEELFAAAEQDALVSDADVAAQARRMLADPKAKRVYQFFEQWLDVDELPAMERDLELYPDYDAALPELLAQETRAFVDHVLWEGDGELGTLLTAPYSFANATLAEHYGLSGVSGDDFVQVDTPGRAGVLTLGGVVSVHDKPTRSSIVLRGLRVRTELLCQVVGAPPADIVVDLPEIAPGMPQSKRLEMHRAEPLCAGCHNLMDPLGVPFESFDATGRLRTEDEQGNPVQTAGAISYTPSSDAKVADAIELSARLAESDEVRACFATQAFRFFYGREEGDADSCSIKQLVSAFEQSNYSIQELLVALTQTDAFLYRPAGVQP
ncbi:MAG TPA: DUF1592 domain-containing protein [Polyangiales bacterium]|nr:DUF1592 domain-containing protein [Polyangiales bacterium]